MAYFPLVERDDIAVVFQDFEAGMAGAQGVQEVTNRYAAPIFRDAKIYLIRHLRLWSCFVQSDEWWTCCLGVGDPTVLPRPTCVLNFPFEGRGTVQGVFARDDEGTTCVIHKGGVYGQRKGSLVNYLVESGHRDLIVDLIWNRNVLTEESSILVGAIGHEQFSSQVKEFVRLFSAFKARRG